MAEFVNTSGLACCEFNVLILPDPVEEKTKGGVFLPDKTKDADQYASTEGTLVAISPHAFTYVDYWPEDYQPPRPGDKVIVARYSGKIVKGSDGKEYWLLKDKDVMAIRSKDEH